MVHGLVYLAFRRNLSAKTLHHVEFLFRRRLPAQILSFPYCQKNTEELDEREKKESKPKPTFVDGKTHLNHILEQAKRGRISPDDLKTLTHRVIAEGQFKNYVQAPQSVQYVGFAGLVPMIGFPLITLLSGHAFNSIIFCHLAYGATILSFLGGSSWYDAIIKNDTSYEKLGWVIAPQVIGWMSLMLPLPLGMLCTTFGFCLSLAHDVLLSSYPQWMKSLRLILTAGTVLSILLISRRRSYSSRSKSDSRSRSRSRRSWSGSTNKKRSRSRSNSSKSHSSSSGDKSKSRKQSKSKSSLSSSSSSTSSSSTTSSLSTESLKRVESPPKITVPRYYGRNRKDSSSSLSLDSSDTDSKANSGEPSSSNPNRNNTKKSFLNDYSSGVRSAGNARPASKHTLKERPQEKLKKKMQALLNKQFRADKKAEKERMEKAEQERQDREAELRDIAIKIRRRERYLRHRGEDEENDGEREALRRRERFLRRSGEEDGRRDEERRSASSESGKSKSRSPDIKDRRSRSPKRSSRQSRSSSPKANRLGKRTLVDY